MGLGLIGLGYRARKTKQA
ncbi:MAG: hypothetical protein L3J88_00930 [Gammaproteobacteria bacterium]|nr:hypothetical protein [Gammaproteobacteria bacterium]MCF6361932.1 hypothetical protein [Gammaproteobacteria bacterium]